MSRAVAALILLVSTLPLAAQTRRGGGVPRQTSLPAANNTAPDLVASFAGKVLISTKKQFTILIAEGEHELTFRLSGKTDFFDGAKKMKLEDLAVGDIVAVDAKRDAIGQLDAVHIKLQKVPELEPAPAPAPAAK